MKKLTVIILFIVFFSVGLDVYAHPGRTDSSGGHNCSEKSKAKGLCTGYHYHNGGSDSSSSSNNNSATNDSAQSTLDKDCSDFSSYEEVIEYWNSKGYTKYYDPERLDGWGNKVDDGIPCEAPAGYDLTKINGSAEQLAELTAEKDQTVGEKEGYTFGLKDGYDDKGMDTDVEGSDAYKEGYELGYSKGYTVGADTLEIDMDAANKSGYELGSKQDEIVIVEAYRKNSILKESFTVGFNKAVLERDEKKKQEFEAMGLKDGKKDNEKQILKDVKELYVTAYEEGFAEGQEELKSKYIQKGHVAAYTMLSYREPNLSKEKYINWYKEGFKSNQEIESIQNKAYNLGLEGEDYKVPEKYKKADVIFKEFYSRGKDEFEQRREDRREKSAAFAGVGILGWLTRRFYVAKKMVK